MKLIEKNRDLVSHQDQQGYLKQIHLFLNQMYYTLLYSDDESSSPTELTVKKFKKVETDWMSFEKNDCLNKYDFNRPVNNVETVRTALKKHSAYQHPIFDYLSKEATESDFKQFITNESILNMEFFDYLALSIIGVSDQTRLEIIRNLWDEAGKGRIAYFHTTLFRRFLKELNISYKRDVIVANMSWEALAGINLFSYFSLYPCHKQKYFGLLAATEMLDPPHYTKLMQGLSRLFSHIKIDDTYYVEHEWVDKKHASTWIEKIIIPELSKRPEKTAEFWLGFYIRLDSVQRYYDSLLSLFMTKKAA